MKGRRAAYTAGLVIAIFTSSFSVAFAGNIVHKIQKGDTLYSLAKKHQTTVSAICQANGLSESSILKLGATLKIPTKSNRVGQITRAVSKTVHIKVDNACLRKGPSTNHEKITSLSCGTDAKVLSKEGSWAKIALEDGTCGYIHRSLLGVGSAKQSESAVDSGLIETALSCRGMKYRRGGTGRGGFDCSGFTRYVFAKYGVSLPHSSAAQAKLGTPVSKSELQAGDLVFFQTYRRGISHVGIYIGNNQFVHAATYGKGVRVDSLNSSYYAPRYRGARRVNTKP